MSVVEICQEIEPIITHDVGAQTKLAVEFWDPARIDHEEYFRCTMPDDRLAALGIRPRVASAIVAITVSPETVRPGLAQEVNECLGFLSAEECIVGPWAKPVLDELGVNGMQFRQPTQDEFERGLSRLMSRMEELEAACV